MSLPSIACSIQNHYKMLFQYVCLLPHCTKNSQELACIYCCQQLHKSHLEHIQAIKILLSEFKGKIQPTEFGAAQILLNGISKCKNQKQLAQNISELICYKNGQNKFQKIIDRKNQVQKQQTKLFYQNRNDDSNLNKTVKKNQDKKHITDANFISPILTFSLDDANEQRFEFESPFCIKNSSEKLVTAFAYPPLNRFKESIEAKIKILRITPFWLGVGVSIGKKRYDNQSKDHIIMTSNGWLSFLGSMQRTQVKYFLKDTVKVKYDKRMKLIQFSCNGQKHTAPLQVSWDQDVYLCCVLFYKDDSVQIMA